MGDVRGSRIGSRELAPDGADALVAQGAIAEAIHAWSHVIDLDPAFGPARLGLAQALIRARPGKAIEPLGVALSMLPHHPAAWLALGVARAMLGEHKDAAAACERAVQLAPDVAAVHLGQGDIVYRSGDFATAERAYRRALELTPDSADALNKLAAIVRTDGRRIHEAETLLTQALDLAPGHPYARVNLALLAVKSRRIDDGRRMLEATLAMPDVPADARAIAEEAVTMFAEREALLDAVVAAVEADDPEPIQAALRARPSPSRVDERMVAVFMRLVESRRRNAVGRPAFRARTRNLERPAADRSALQLPVRRRSGVARPKRAPRRG